jgi:RNA polymerase sigma-70 factor, ECF subfamily
MPSKVPTPSGRRDGGKQSRTRQTQSPLRPMSHSRVACMEESDPTGEISSFTQYREYLFSLARARFDPRLWATGNSSAVVEDPLVRGNASGSRVADPAEEELAGWLHTILNNSLASALQPASCQLRDISPLSGGVAGTSFASPVRSAADRQLPHEKIAIRNEQMLRLSRALAGLPDDERGVVELKHLHGLSIDEICERTGRSKPSVVVLLFRGVKALRIPMGEPARRAEGTGPERN